MHRCFDIMRLIDYFTEHGKLICFSPWSLCAIFLLIKDRTSYLIFFFFSILLSAVLNLLLCTQILCENNHFHSYWYFKLDFFLSCWNLFLEYVLEIVCICFALLFLWNNFLFIDMNFIHFYYWSHILHFMFLLYV